MEDKDQWLQIRRAMLQIDRIKTRKKAIKRLKHLLTSSSSSLTPMVWTALCFAYYYDQHFEHTLFYCRQTMSLFPLRPESVFCASIMVHLYSLMGQDKQQFEAEGSRIRLMKNIIMKSSNPEHRDFAMQELKQAFEERDLLSHFYTLVSQAQQASPLPTRLSLPKPATETLN